MSGMIYVSLGLVAIAIAVWSRAFVTSRGAGVAGAAVFVVLLAAVAEAAISALTGHGIDLATLWHLRTGLGGAGVGDFAATLAAVLALGAMAVLAGALTLWRGRGPQRRPGRIWLGAGALALALGLNPGVGEIARLVQATAGASAAVAPVLPDGVIPAARISLPARPRNFVLIYAEQLERTYLDPVLFPGLMPELAALEAEAVSFTDIRQLPGTEWTIGGMVASLCGVPLALPLGNVGGGFDQFLPAVSCLTDRLAGAGVTLSYMGGAQLAFAGKGQFLADHGFARIEGAAALEPLLDDPSYTSWWGIYDDTLFDLARARFEALLAEGAPFGLVLLTLDTHQPDGHLSASCEGLAYGDGANPILNAVHCSDRLIARFIRDIRARAGDDTVVMLVSDHLAMENTASGLLAQGDRRNLALLFAPGLPAQRIDRPGATLDTGATLMAAIGAEVPGLQLGRDLLGPAPTLVEREADAEAALWADWGYFAGLWALPGLDAGLRLTGEDRLALGARHIELPALLLTSDGRSVDEIRFEDPEFALLPDQLAELGPEQGFVWVDACGRLAQFGITPPGDGDPAARCVLVGPLGAADPLVRRLIPGERVRAATLAKALAAPEDATLRAARLELYEARRWSGGLEPGFYQPSARLTGHFGLVSSGGQARASTATNIDLGLDVTLRRGVTLLGLASDAAPVMLGHVDTCGAGGVIGDGTGLETGLARAILAHGGRYRAFAVLVDDSAVCEGPGDLAALFAGTPFQRWTEIGPRTPYVGIIDGNGGVIEFTGPPETGLAVEALGLTEPLGREARDAMQGGVP